MTLPWPPSAVHTKKEQSDKASPFLVDSVAFKALTHFNSPWHPVAFGHSVDYKIRNYFSLIKKFILIIYI